jgi:hypothetical protein
MTIAARTGWVAGMPLRMVTTCARAFFARVDRRGNGTARAKRGP